MSYIFLIFLPTIETFDIFKMREVFYHILSTIGAFIPISISDCFTFHMKEDFHIVSFCYEKNSNWGLITTCLYLTFWGNYIPNHPTC